MFLVTDHYLLGGGGGPLYLGGGSLFSELHFGEGHFLKKYH